MKKLYVLLAAVCAAAAAAQNADWSKPFPAHRIIGPVYYVGTADLACFLITSPKGHILINTGLADSAAMIRKSIESLGFKPADIKVLLTMQGHFDHTAALAELKKATGAKFYVTQGDQQVMEDGGKSDFELNKPEYFFAPVKADRVLNDGDAINDTGVSLQAHLTPGHTRGSVTYTMAVKENGKDYNVCFANMNSMIGAPLVNNAKYPKIAQDYARGFRVQKALACDVFLAAHGSQYNLQKKYKPTYNPEMFVDPSGYKAAVAKLESAYLEQLKTEQSKTR